ncbi:MAG: ABC-F family ATP-binding cassette domain-containing protein [Oscillospiraceae bacterium]|nr:ABC-F family ATP-binding cassette domain-containing protein [Oscillospiraceae bacterium]
MADISVHNLKLGFEVGENVLEDVTFDIFPGEHVGILGRNGAGKTTLFRCLTGELSPDEGEILIAPGKRLGVLSQIPVYPPEYTAEDVLKTAHERVYALGRQMEELEGRMSAGDKSREVLNKYDAVSHEFMRLGGYELRRHRDTVANGLGIPEAQRGQLFSELSGGERTRINLARLILEDTDILLLDEPTNHLDMAATAWLEDYISRFKGTVLAISHDRWFLDNAVTRIIEILGGTAEFYPGSYSFYVEEKRRRYEERLKQYEKEQAKIKQLRKAAEDLHLWAFMGADKLHKRAFSMEKRIEKLEKTEKPQTEQKLKARFSETRFRADEVVLARGLSKSFGERTLFSSADFLIRGGERVALIGDNGTGKSTLIKMIMNQEEPTQGLLRLGPSVKTAYLPQIVTFEDEGRTVLDTMMYEGKMQMQEARDRLGAYLIGGEDVYTRVSQLSGGEKSRLKLCMIMRGSVNLLILDEPTNHLDIASREWMEDALADYGEALLFVSHDRYFIKKFATRILEIRDGRIWDYQCGYERYLELRAREKAGMPLPEKLREEKPPQEERQKKMSPSTRERLVKKLERDIAAKEALLDENQRQQEEAASDYAKLMELSAEWDRLQDELAQLYLQWEEAAE